MSSLTTPTRISPRLVIPGLDTKSPANDMATAITYAGLHTPPQSAHESRRPSIQPSWSDAPYSAGASGFACSHPTTPIHRIQNGHDNFVHGWSDADIASSGASRHLDQHIVDSGFSNHGCHTPAVHGLPPYPNAPQHISADAFSLHFNPGLPSTEAWTRPGQSANTFAAQTAYLGSELFPITQSLPSESTFPGLAFPHSEPALHGLNVNFDVTAIRPVHDHGVHQGPLYHNPQVIVPSQLSPQDAYDHSQFDEYADLGQSTNAISNSFESSSVMFDSFEAMDPPSPMEAYFDHSEDEDYFVIKTEETSFDPRTHRSATASRFSVASKRRSSKRLRSERRPWHRHETGGIEVQCEGKQFRLDRPVKYVAGNGRKLHVCTYLKEGKECGAGFERSEHLKRHVGSHTKERPYVCPLDKCDKKIQRPDNACDHFKTHLRPPKKGKRNHYVEWPDLQHAIWEKFEDKKKARKILENLTKWYKGGMQDASGRGRRG